MQNSAKQTDTTQNGVQPYESPIRRAPKKFNFWRGIYNKDKNYILGRTPKNWGKKKVKNSFEFHIWIKVISIE